MQAELTVEIARAPEEVFAYLTDVANVGAWQSGVHHAEIVGGGEPRAGARIAESRHLLGRELHTTLEIAEFDPPHVFTLRALDAPIAFTVRHELEAAGSGTRLRVVAEGDPGLLPGFAAGLVARRAEKQFKKDFARLKSQLER
ncbi:MAG TPA: SRPBCC family protein [Gaiellaceae bacterium]|nr:SRPBCC family protein [Gaiellaceae bacterium]